MTMYQFEDYEKLLLEGLNKLEIVIVNEDKNILLFLESIKQFQEKGTFKNGTEAIAFLSQIKGYDSGFGFRYNNVTYLIYRVGKVGDSGYYMFVSKSSEKLRKYMLENTFLDPDIRRGFAKWLSNPLSSFSIQAQA